MEGAALYWVTWLKGRKPNMSWEEFKQALVARFDFRYQGNRFERLSGVKQIGQVEDYNTLFVQLASQVPGLTDDHYLGYYMSRLKETIRSSLRLLRPENLETAMELARDIEHNLSVQSGESGSLNYHSSGVRSSSFVRANTGPPLTATAAAYKAQGAALRKIVDSLRGRSQACLGSLRHDLSSPVLRQKS
ncbi:unnamed protein product [Cuscuta epithymum]|uniref:Ty3 transposon capsid-like protein domain-containing protein n=1 Tax=Cuscuta epithymum TaxID=186058 RepID=A0AAV0CT95_9ASTE|nr:unnamed protein product [Cuscuta epithymum]